MESHQIVVMRGEMPYSVTHGSMKARPVARDTWEDLPTALAHACYLLLEGKPNVTIVDGNGNQISDDDLVRLMQRDEAA